MLTIRRKPGQKIRIGNDIVIHVKEHGKIGIEAPKGVKVLRGELKPK